MNLLIQAGADVNIRSSYDGFTPLMSAVITSDENCLKIVEELEIPFVEENHSHTKCVEMLLKSGADVNITVPTGTSALLFALQNSHMDCARMFIKAGASVNISDKYGYNAVVGLTMAGNEELLQEILKQGTSVNSLDQYGKTPLLIAAGQGDKKCVSLLVNSGADVNMTDRSGQTALIGAVRAGSLHCTTLLLQAGARINGSGFKGADALKSHLAQSRTPDKRLSKLLHAAGEIFVPSFFCPLPDFLQYRKHKLRLKHICREVIRNHLLQMSPHEHPFARIPGLPLPPALKSYLLFNVSLVAPIGDSSGLDDEDYDDDDDDDDSDYGDSGLEQETYTIASNMRQPVPADTTYTTPSQMMHSGKPNMTYTVPDIKFSYSEGSKNNCKTQ